ncbi:hypothetical protein VNI00_009540 [Paramarasmius palmivorus]|uniref:Uncharacterized protein n=1 Tax=Paramarasmius palmivorus TaxID=297713 RepID=A0AAW0CP66_9AGAR
MSSTLSLAFRKDRSAFHLPSLNTGEGDTPIKYHPAPSRNEIAVVQPVLVKHVEGELLTAVAFIPRHLITSTKNGHLKLWIRPLVLRTLKGKRSPQQHGSAPKVIDVN